MARERKGYLLLAAFNPTLLVRGALKKGEKRRGRGRKRARTRRRRRPNGGSCGCCASSSLWPDIDPSIADQYPKEKLRSRLRRPGRKRYRSHGSSLLAILSDQRDSQANFRVFPPFLSNTLLRLELMRGFDRARSNGTIREFFCSEAVVGTSRGWFESVVFLKGGFL